MRLHTSGIKEAQQQLLEVTQASDVDSTMQKKIEDSRPSDIDWENHTEFIPVEPIMSQNMHNGNTRPVEVQLNKEHT